MSVFIGYPSFMAYQMMKGKKDNNDGFPSIPGTIARYSASGLTNEQMAANPVWVDKTGRGHDIQLKNFSWKGMSGVGGYEMNFNLWRNNVSSIPDISMSTTTTSVSVSVGNSTYNNNLIYIHINNWDINKNHWLKVTSTYEDGDLAFIFYNDSNTKKIRLPANGYVNILAYPEFKGSYMYISTISNKQGSFTIEQLPLYSGALVFDGVDDYGVCENFPILTKEKGYTVVALRQYLVEKSTAYLTANGDSISNTSFIFEGNNYRDTWNFGKATGIQASRILATQTSKQYDGVKLNIGTNAEGSNLLQVGKWNKSYSNVAIWELVFLDHDATEEELTKIKDYFVKTYPWLFPDQAWTVVGKTNENEDRATIANITGNGNDLVLSNFGFAEGSGYGLYETNFMNWVDSHRATFTRTSSKINVTAVLKEEYATFTYSTESRLKQRIKVTGLPEGVSLILGRTNFVFYTIAQDGIYDIDVTDDSGSSSPIIGYRINKILDSCDITIEQIPEYEGYPVTDGVDDKAVSKQFKFGENFTVILDFKFPVKKISYCGFDLSSKVRIQNLQDSGVYVVLKGNKTLIPSNVVRAVTSEGKVYDENWNEYNIVPGNISSNYTMVNLGFDGSNQFAESATKLAGIYSSTLSKDDCIKAYNYLQTLKAK